MYFLPQNPNFLCWNYFHSIQKGHNEVMWSQSYIIVWFHHMSLIPLSYTTCETSAVPDAWLQPHSVSLRPLFGNGLKTLWSKLNRGICCKRQISKTKGESDSAREVIPITCGTDTTISAERTAKTLYPFFSFFLFIFVFDDHEEQRAPSHPLGGILLLRFW